MILDAWGTPGVGGAVKDLKPDRNRYGMEKSQFLYDSESRQNPIYAGDLEHFIHWQFADCSSVGPFRYHSVRSLGFLLYSVCHLENRLGCKFSDAVFESLMQYFRVNNMGDAERALKIDLTDKRPLPDGIQFVPPADRWKIDERLVQMAMAVNKQTIQENSENFTHAFDPERGDSETATRTMAKMSSSASMVSSMLGRAYLYKTHEYKEIMRRLCLDTNDTSSVDANKFRAACLRQGVPTEALQVDRMNIVPARIMAGGNKILQIAMMDKIMALYFPKLDPSAQREALRLGLSITTEDYQLAARWVPDEPSTSPSRHDAQLAAGLMLSGMPMDLKQGVNHDEYVEALLQSLAVRVQQIQSGGKPVEPGELIGLQNLAGQSIQGQPIKGGNGIMEHIQILEGQITHHIKGHPDEKTAKQKIKGYLTALGKLMNTVKAMAQQAAEAAKKQQAQGPQLDPKDQAKIQGMMLLAQTKAKNASESHAQRTAQRQIQWEQQMKQREQDHGQEMVHAAHEHIIKTLESE
jgi:hypothetical protein